MARAGKSGNGRLEEAMNQLIQTQAAFLGRVAETDRQLLEIKKEMIETQRINNDRFARIEATLLDHTRILQHLADAIEALPDAIRVKFGFRPPE